MIQTQTNYNTGKGLTLYIGMTLIYIIHIKIYTEGGILQYQENHGSK